MTLQVSTQDATGPLRDAVRRAVRNEERCWVALGLHLSRLAPGPRPHHVRVARSVLNDAASRRGGQLFTFGAGDFVLLFPAPDGGVGLMLTLAQLFAPDAPNAELLLSRWLLPANASELHAYLDAVPTLVAMPKAVEVDAGLAAVARLSESVDPAHSRDLLERQTGILMAMTGPDRILPVFRELRFSLAALEARAAAHGHVTADPFMFRHLIDKLGNSLVDVCAADLQEQDGVLAWAQGGKLTLHLNMSPAAILSSAFERLVEAAERVEARLAIEIAFVEACADAAAFARACRHIRAAGLSAVLDDVSHHALRVLRPAAFDVDLVKLDWSSQLAQRGADAAAHLGEVDPAKLVLQRADSEDAIRWGVANGIRRFQGQHVDAILAASRIATCEMAERCTLGQCTAREVAATRRSRAGCGNLPLLDAIIPRSRRAA